MKYFIDLNYNLQIALIETYGERVKSAVFEQDGEKFTMYDFAFRFEAEESSYFDLDLDSKTELKPQIKATNFKEISTQIDRIRAVVIRRDNTINVVRVK
jgi:hypothetical protein